MSWEIDETGPEVVVLGLGRRRVRWETTVVPGTRTPEEEHERRFDQDMAAREGELRDLAAEREEDE